MTETTEGKLKNMATQSRQRLMELGTNWAKLGIDRTTGAISAATKSLEATRMKMEQWKDSLPSAEASAAATPADGKAAGKPQKPAKPAATAQS